MSKAYPYPSPILAAKLREAGLYVQTAWEVKANRDAKGVAWLTCYIVSGTPERPALGTVIVQTFMEGHWEAWMPASDSNRIDRTVDAVIARATATKETA